jgi:uncharacterized protein YciI
MRDTRRKFIGMALAVAASGFAVAQSASAARPTYLVVYRRGPAWIEGKPMREQPSMKEHFAYYVGLHRKGLLVSGGGFTDESGGAAVIEAADDAAAEAIMAADPAVQSKVFSYELKRWKANPWEEISKARAVRGE